MRQGVRQYLAGTVVNERLNVPRADYDRLKATLTNCLDLVRRAKTGMAIRRFGRISKDESPSSGW